MAEPEQASAGGLLYVTRIGYRKDEIDERE